MGSLKKNKEAHILAYIACLDFRCNLKLESIVLYIFVKLL